LSHSKNPSLTEQYGPQNTAILEAKHKLNLVVCDAKTRKTMPALSSQCESPYLEQNDRFIEVNFLKKTLRRILLAPVLLVLLFEEWGWEPLARAFARLGQWPLWANQVRALCLILG